MKATITKSDLVNGLKAVTGVASGKGKTLPILSHLLIEAKGGRLTITGTDLDLTVQATVPATIEGDFSTTVPSRKFSQIGKESPSEAVEIEVLKNNTLKIVSGSSSFKVCGLPSEEFPSNGKFNTQYRFLMNQEDLREGIKRVESSVSTDETRYVLNGVLFQLTSNLLTLVATDGRRLSMSKHKVPFDGGEKKFILPSRAVSELSKLIGKDGDVVVEVCDNKASFAMADRGGSEITIASKLIDGSYPNYQQVIPDDKSVQTTAVVDAENLMESVSRVSLMATEKSYSVNLDFTEKELVIKAGSPEFGNAEERHPLAVKGGPVSIWASPKYVIDALASVGCEAKLRFIDPLSPILITNETGFTGVVMPVRPS
jgi:DNA polymerase III subunit beta